MSKEQEQHDARARALLEGAGFLNDLSMEGFGDQIGIPLDDIGIRRASAEIEGFQPVEHFILPELLYQAFITKQMHASQSDALTNTMILLGKREGGKITAHAGAFVPAEFGALVTEDGIMSAVEGLKIACAEYGDNTGVVGLLIAKDMDESSVGQLMSRDAVLQVVGVGSPKGSHVSNGIVIHEDSFSLYARSADGGTQVIPTFTILP